MVLGVRLPTCAPVGSIPLLSTNAQTPRRDLTPARRSDSRHFVTFDTFVKPSDLSPPPPAARSLVAVALPSGTAQTAQPVNHVRPGPDQAFALLVDRVFAAHAADRKRGDYGVERGLRDRDPDHAARGFNGPGGEAASPPADAAACRARKAPETPSYKNLQP